MKISLLIVANIGLGLALGSGLAFLALGDPGPDFDWMHRPNPVGVNADSDEETIFVVGGDEYDYGVMDRGATRSHTFIIHNATSEPVRPKVTSTTCKCTVGELVDKLIPPGGQGKVTLEWEARSLDEEFRQSATVATSNDVRPDIVLSVYGRVIQMVSVKPRSIAFSDVTVRDTRVGECVIFSNKHDDLTVSDFYWTDKDTEEFFEVSWKQATADVIAREPDAKTAVVVTVTMKPGLPLGTVYQRLNLKLSVSEAGSVDVPIMANVVGDVLIQGNDYAARNSTLKFGPVARGKGKESKLHLSFKGDFAKEVEILDVETDPQDALAVDVGDVRLLREGRIALIPMTVRVVPDAPVANYLGGGSHAVGKIRLKTNHPDAQDLVINVVFAVID